MKKLLFIFLYFFTGNFFYSQRNSPAHGAVVAFWNVENLYDTIDDPLKDDDEFTPSGKLAWTNERYWQKINNLARVIAEINSEVPGSPLGMMGLCEIENVQVLRHLVLQPAIASLHLKPVLIEGPDARGVDVALLYRDDFFILQKTVSFQVQLPVDTAHKTRDILVVSGLVDKQPLCVIINHWPSRRGGEAESRPNRIAVAKKVRSLTDSVLLNYPATRIMIMGDFNDDPADVSIKKTLYTTASQIAQKGDLLFNPMEKLYKAGSGTLAWRDNWNLFDQILLSHSWLTTSGLKYSEARIFNKKYLLADFGNYKNYPFRTYSGGAYTGGFSDHLPVFLILRPSIPTDLQQVK